MTQEFWRVLLVYLFLLSTIVGCGERMLPYTETVQNQLEAEASDSSSAAPQTDWKAISGEGVILSLPQYYEGGNPSTEIDKIAAQLEKISPGYSQRLESLRQNPQAIALLAFDPQSANGGFMTNVNITKEQVPDGVTLEQYLQAAIEELNRHYQILEQNVVSVDSYPAGRIVAESTTGKTPIKQIFYTVQDGNRFWLVTYSTTTAEFDQRLPTFEQSILTLKLLNPN